MMFGEKRIIDAPPALKAFMQARADGASKQELENLSKAAAEEVERLRGSSQKSNAGTVIDFAARKARVEG